MWKDIVSMHALRQYVEEQMDARGWDRSELGRRSGLSRQQIHRLLTDDRERLPERPEPQTIESLASAFGAGTERTLWLRVAAAMGLPVDSPDAGDASRLSDDELMHEIAARLSSRLVVVGSGATATVTPRRYDDVRRVGQALRGGNIVRLDLTKVTDNDAKRIVDFAAGLVFALQGRFERLNARIFELHPAGSAAHFDGYPIASLAQAAMEDPPAPVGQSEEGDL